ncbi:MAG: Ig-like domain-containing protein [Candidatus Riflebacteria bacterium]|nr:Ig-like domain-containing protein [Candidatus Riflebacteria bacterium]
MKTQNIVKQLLYVTICLLTVTLIAGCTSANSINSLNPAAADPEAELNIGDTTKTTTTDLKPVVNIYAASNVVGPEAELMLRAEAIDPAGGQVTVEWEADAGNIISTDGSKAVWKAPTQSSSNIITCVATDVRGGTARADYTVDVVGNSTYRLTICADRTSVLTGRISADSTSPVVPIGGARIELTAIGEVGVSDSNGMVEFNIDQAQALATSTLVVVKHLGWEVSYNVSLLVGDGLRIIDELTFYPGYDGVSVAVARGDSFMFRRGMIEVTAVENSAGVFKPVAEVTIDAGANQALSDAGNGRASLSTNIVGNGETSIRLARGGYQTIEDYFVPISVDGLTLVNAQLAKVGSISELDAIISWTRPYNNQTAFPVSGPFEIGFGQPMEKSSIFNDISLMIQDKSRGTLIALSGTQIEQHFRPVWKSGTVLQLFPKQALSASTRYSMLISRWNARATDGRMLKTYEGLYGEFITDADPSPTIVSTSPKNGDTDIGRSGPFAIRFDRSMKPNSLYDNLKIEITNLDSGAKMVLDGTSLRSNFAVKWKESNTLLELVPYRMLRAGGAYLIRLKECNLVSESGKKVFGFENLWGQFKTGGL